MVATVLHRYKNGYSVLPELQKLGDKPVFERTQHDYDRYIADKRAALDSQPCFVEADMSAEIYQTVCEWIVRSFPVPLQQSESLSDLMMQIQEDIVIHRMDDDKDWVSCGHVCLPSSWNLADVIGKSFVECHQPVPGMELGQSRRMVEAMVHHGPFERFQWGVFFEDRLNYHPWTASRKQFDPQNPFVMVKVERQVLYGFPKLNAAAFVLRQHLLPESTLDKIALAAALEGMSSEQRLYKGIATCAPRLIDYLRQTAP